jgi:hypothetical protein
MIEPATSPEIAGDVAFANLIDAFKRVFSLRKFNQTFSFGSSFWT